MIVCVDDMCAVR